MMIQEKLDPKAIQVKFGLKDFSLGSIMRNGGDEHQKNSHLANALLTLDSNILHEHNLLEWVLLNVVFCDEADKVREMMKEYSGEEYAKRFEDARLIAWRSSQTKDLETVLGFYAVLKEHDLLDLGVNEFIDCISHQNMKEKLALHARLVKGDLNGFYNENFADLFTVGRYRILGGRGIWEAYGGLGLYISDDFYFSCKGREIAQKKKLLVSVAGNLYHCNQKSTRVKTIQGEKDKQEEIREFHQEQGIHPANFLLLLYLKLGQILGHENVQIASFASRTFNHTEKDSTLYDIPRNYFRLRPNPENRRYEFDAPTRDKILEKFAKKSRIVQEAFQKIEEYLA